MCWDMFYHDGVQVLVDTKLQENPTMIGLENPDLFRFANEQSKHGFETVSGFSVFRVQVILGVFLQLSIDQIPNANMLKHILTGIIL